ncbi:MAG: hypothetical protein APG12_00803 [Candidatus Methanofastidiosum methylothiophilum]|uniref:Uncharacterized protein n=1 Tax=Candidatus Methanofastidiosum methylothiophilum TaxID=1705564 RepID=A0A150IZQ3_9EURY|nr:MAG: hypothetical protein APG10_00531 [Candidatus Methanofastidiosum methylthiophilus]KYC48080.1 MAG: hypothetical protein APG11_00650 [Candidatus Methanofastidiosum methylthiophilus]KYC50471.1 MAG: hypothetical protein APG12_00803 [Candidatus Methanofastidiosum methylthiophilus]
MNKILAIMTICLFLASVAPLIGETCTSEELNSNTTCQSSTKIVLSKIAAKTFLNNIRNGTMDFHGNKLVHSILTPVGDVKLTSPSLQKNFGSYEFTNERSTPGWHSYDIQRLTKAQKQYEPMVPKIYTTNTSDQE